MKNYIDGFVFSLPKKHLDTYQKIAEQVSEIWLEHGALSYQEFVGDDMALDGVISFIDTLNCSPNEIPVFGWVVFPSKEIRDKANTSVPMDPRMTELVAPLMDEKDLIFDARRMIYGGFKAFV
ncbi:Uncharacterized conserved protein YbaA, DUF1428 family [Lishizhenia tianjinensis]|uniref:Uncharacterized conserved protein YbaA, DUF1428 family n=1 Tax=Lishizhenia tianjinensis TaxID=477690 RepID=A0A1I6XA48_9FLAO|nr:DUF1428 domain-containing protein [Lishizhenia tianjinensis]SFT35185.1 Uncharacterized conserved protein YbaA, DUF1428 family [Lishizhenia tianjinensis]